MPPFINRICFSLLRSRVDTHLLALPVVALELHHSGNFGEERIIAPLPHVRTGMELCPALPHDDTLFAKITGVVKFERYNRERKKVSVYATA